MTDAQLAHYAECLKNGCSEKLAEMLALGSPPMSNTDREFLQGRGGCYDQFGANPQIGAYYAKVAKAAGVDTTGKLYLSGLAAFPGDPKAWVTGRGDVKRVCEERGWGCSGAVNMPVRRVAEVSGGGLGEDIIEREVEARLQENPEARPLDLREKVIEQHAPYWARDIPVEATNV